MRGVLTWHPTSPGSGRSVIDVDNRAEIREFLISRRAKITPQRAGLPDVGIRRVPGLRRGEVAALAGVRSSITPSWNAEPFAGVSASVLDAIARALSLTTPNLLNLTLYSAEPGSPTAHALAPDDSTTRWS